MLPLATTGATEAHRRGAGATQKHREASAVASALQAWLEARHAEDAVAAVDSAGLLGIDDTGHQTVRYAAVRVRTTLRTTATAAEIATALRDWDATFEQTDFKVQPRGSGQMGVMVQPVGLVDPLCRRHPVTQRCHCVGLK